MKRCVHCKQNKSHGEFYKHSHTRDRLCSWCKECHRGYKDGAYHEKLRQKHKLDPRQGMLSDAKKRSRQQKIPFSLTLDDIIVPTICPVLGTILMVGKGKVTPDSPSLDRLRPELGYIRGNVAVISYRANRIKNDATYDELLRLVDYMKWRGGW